MLATILQAAVSAQVRPEPVAANLCDVVASPAEYNKKLLLVTGILFPSEHSLALYSPSCRPKEGFDVTIQAVLPPYWESLPNGKQLRKFLHRGKSASVKLIGTFEGDAHRYGPDGARFRFVISEISSVEKAPDVPGAGTGHEACSAQNRAAGWCTRVPVGALAASSQIGPKLTQVNSLTVADEVVRYLKPAEASARDSEAVDRPEVADLFGRYRYAWRGTRWQFREIVSPLVQRYAMFWFFASGGLDDYSKLTLLINRATGQQYLIPVQNHGMVGYPKVEDDPHNIAIFNGLVAAESIHPESATDWLRLGLLYLNLIGERHQISDWEDASGESHPGMLTLLPRLKNLGLLPLVSCDAGKCDVRVFDLHPDQSHCVAWTLEFDSHGVPPQLDAVSRELRPLPGAQR